MNWIELIIRIHCIKVVLPKFLNFQKYAYLLIINCILQVFWNGKVIKACNEIQFFNSIKLKNWIQFNEIFDKISLYRIHAKIGPNYSNWKLLIVNVIEIWFEIAILILISNVNCNWNWNWWSLGADCLMRLVDWQ